MYKRILSLFVLFFVVVSNFTNVSAAADVTPPIIKNMTWSATELQVGDKLLVEIDATDIESGINFGSFDTSVYIKHKITGAYKAQQLAYDESSKKLKATFNITTDMQAGEWALYFVSLKDNAGNQKYYHQSDFSQEYKVNIISSVTDITPPSISGMTWLSNELQAGDKMLVEIDATDTESGINFGSLDTSIYIKHKITGVYKAQQLAYDESSKKLKATFNITTDMQAGEWVLYFVSLKDNAGNQKYYHQSDFSQEYKFDLKSVFQGTENLSIEKGAQFSPLNGVKAICSFEGDFTDKITFTGIVDSNAEGIYLLKYEAIGKNGDVYRDYRWVSVVSNLAYNENGEMEGTFFNKEISLNLSNLVNLNSINLTRNGNSYVLSDNSTISEEGKYILSFNSNVNQVNPMKRSLKASSAVLSESPTNIQPSNFEFMIDKTSPEVLECYPQTIDEGAQISPNKFVKVSDNNKLSYEYLTEPIWTKIGEQSVEVLVKDLAGNQVTQEAKLTIIDKCDIDRDGKISIIDLASVAQNYNVKSTQVNWNLRFDFNKDNIIDIFDLVTCSRRLN
ncbi:DUF5011 domain-containing protein [Clostridium sp. YIM B02515]|uniref:DUF5011 domain-containing protein n=1 Tax=Clostridium rhizosphaerae TaxID=2803861 RepID=A0ABS1T6F8_9CLOT|nr:immunoglobulin-like domain-containing protein [Clostridium rhizosphaerae]MBL4934707.1 DUF5011 domain-containing protein [Clostridium rhizosphaerae]